MENNLSFFLIQDKEERLDVDIIMRISWHTFLTMKHMKQTAQFKLGFPMFREIISIF